MSYFNIVAASNESTVIAEYIPEASRSDSYQSEAELNLNNYHFTDSEWERFFKEIIANANDGIVEKTRRVQTDHIQNLRRDDGTTKNITLIDKKNIHNNRYDVTILANGLPLIHVELKRRDVAIREAFNQIKRYQRDSFWDKIFHCRDTVDLMLSLDQIGEERQPSLVGPSASCLSHRAAVIVCPYN